MPFPILTCHPLGVQQSILLVGWKGKAELSTQVRTNAYDEDPPAVLWNPVVHGIHHLVDHVVPKTGIFSFRVYALKP
jgi:hypothetical protein